MKIAYRYAKKFVRDLTTSADTSAHCNLPESIVMSTHSNWSLDSIHAALPAIEQELARTAAERDKAGGHAAEQKELLRRHGLLLLAVPQEYGGIGAPWSEIFAIVRRIARVDSAMAHLLAFQTLQVSGVVTYGSDQQRQLYLGETATLNHWWGNSANPADPRLIATDHEGALV